MKPEITKVGIAYQPPSRFPAWHVEYKFAGVMLALTVPCAQDAFEAQQKAELLLAPYGR